MKKLFLLALLMGLNFGALAQNEKELNQFDWLLGQWKGETEQGIFYEQWEETDHNTLMGLGSFVKAGDTLFQEKLRIQKIAGYWCYIASPGGKPPVLFTLVSAKNNQWVFENQEHDFPQTITYTQKTDGSLLAVTEGNKDGQPARQEFAFKKEY